LSDSEPNEFLNQFSVEELRIIREAARNKTKVSVPLGKRDIARGIEAGHITLDFTGKMAKALGHEAPGVLGSVSRFLSFLEGEIK